MDSVALSRGKCRPELLLISVPVVLYYPLRALNYIVAAAVGIVADYLISSALVNCGIDLRINYCIGMIVTIWFIINELISILENLSEIGIPLPKFLVSIVKRLKTTVEVKTDESEE